MKNLQPTTKQRLEDALRQRDEASKTAMELVKMVERLIEKLRNTRMVMADAEVNKAMTLLARVKLGGKA